MLSFLLFSTFHLHQLEDDGSIAVSVSVSVSMFIILCLVCGDGRTFLVTYWGS